MRLKFSVSAETSIGQVRKQNEDAFLVAVYDVEGGIRQFEDKAIAAVDCTDTSVLIAVADGLGGHAGGEIASWTAISAMRDFVQRQVELGEFNAHLPARSLLNEAIQECHRQVTLQGANSLTLRGMASTLTAGWIAQDRLHVMHVGDSRAYLLRNSVLIQLTTDHTLANRVFSGLNDLELQLNSQFSNVLWNTIGGGESIPSAEIVELKLEASDSILFCTDGLTNAVDHAAIQEILSDFGTPKDQCEDLVRLANGQGGKDNITALVLQVHETCDPDTYGNSNRDIVDISMDDTVDC
ncbi:MAG: protein phosphatase 2C domain-containing protein [Pirellulales bacterium]